MMTGSYDSRTEPISNYPHLIKEYAITNKVPISERLTRDLCEWKCSECSWEWKAKLSNRKNIGQGCPACSGRVTRKSTSELYPHIVSLFSDKNGVGIDEAKKTTVLYSWECGNGHSWESTIHDQRYRVGCVHCLGTFRGTNVEMYGEVFEKFFPGTEEEFNLLKRSDRVEWVCSLGHVWNSILRTMTKNRRCKVCHTNTNKKSKSVSNGELELRKFLDSSGIEYISNDRSLIAPMEVDILVKDSKLAIEFNGTFWHSSRFKSQRYHSDKDRRLMELDYDTFLVWEDVFCRSPDAVYTRLQQVMGLLQEYPTKDLHVWYPSSKNKAANNFLKRFSTSPEIYEVDRIAVYHGTQIIGVISAKRVLQSLVILDFTCIAQNSGEILDYALENLHKDREYSSGYHLFDTSLDTLDHNILSDRWESDMVARPENYYLVSGPDGVLQRRRPALDPQSIGVFDVNPYHHSLEDDSNLVSGVGKILWEMRL